MGTHVQVFSDFFFFFFYFDLTTAPCSVISLPVLLHTRARATVSNRLTAALMPLVSAGGAASPGCGGVLQLPALGLSHGLHHHTLPHCQRQGVLRVLLEGERNTCGFLVWVSQLSEAKVLTTSCHHLLSCPQLMRKVLGTHLGHSAIYTMCRIMEERYSPS